MKEFIEKNRRLLKFYCVGARTIGWILLLSTPIRIALMLLLSGGSWPEGYGDPLNYILSPSSISLMMFGVVVLGVGQFIRYVFETEYEQGWILRHGVTILYLCAVVNIALAGVMILMIFNSSGDVPRQARMLLRILWVLHGLIPFLAKALLLVGLGRILQRIMPVIEESKTLV
jgi:hypothetical protein